MLNIKGTVIIENRVVWSEEANVKRINLTHKKLHKANFNSIEKPELEEECDLVACSFKIVQTKQIYLNVHTFLFSCV